MPVLGVSAPPLVLTTPPPQPRWITQVIHILMLFSFLIASVGTVPTNTLGTPTPINITNRCGIDGAVDHEFLVTLKQDVANSDGRRLDTTEDKLSFLQGWVAQYTVDQHDSEGTYSNGTTRRKLEANSTRVSNSTHVLHFFTVTQLAVAVGASDEVRRAHGCGAPPARRCRTPTGTRDSPITGMATRIACI